MIAQKARPWLPLLLLLVFFALGMTQVRYASITFDEGPHLAVGYTTLRTRDLRLQPVHIHPPLANVLAAAPLLLQPDLPDPTTIDGWESASLSAIADAVVRIGEDARGDGPICFVPDILLADDESEVDSVKRGLRDACARLCELEWETLLLAHGLPLLENARQELRAFAQA